jgi:putative ABC transport system substrate-binding protein
MNRTRTGLAAAVALLISAASLSAEGQPTGSVHRVGFLTSGAVSSPVLEGFRQGLRERGWIEGQNVVIDHRAAGGHDQLPAEAADLVRLKVDVIVALATPATSAAKSATATIPIVMIAATDPVRSGFVASLARPAGNVTGLTHTGAGMEILGKQLEFLVQAVPKAGRVAVLSNPTNQNHPAAMKAIREAGRSLGVQLQLLEARSPNELDGAFAAMAKEQASALFLMTDSLFIVHRTRIAALAAKNGVPLLGFREIVEVGGLMSYGPSLSNLGERASTYVDKIFKGAKPADLPVEQPTKLELVVNLKTAKTLGLTIPQDLLLRADHVIE